jgi:methylamine dehydrogenase accessory protein MauD
METALIISNLVLWILVIVLSLAVYALVRQVGVLYERVAPAGALMVSQGPKAGAPSPVLSFPDFNSDQEISIGGISANGKSRLLFFLSTTCPVCDSLIPILKSLAAEEDSWLELIFASDGTEAEHRQFVQLKELGAFSYIISMDLGIAFQVGKLPYAVLIDGEGVVRAHGLTNSREHIESLFEAMDKGVASIQEYQQRRQQSQAEIEVKHYEPS